MIDHDRFVKCVNLLEDTKDLGDKIKGALDFSRSLKQTTHFYFDKSARKSILKLKAMEILLNDERLLHLDKNASFKIRTGANL